ncbi:MAG: protein kinase [Myxococcota bacterium]
MDKVGFDRSSGDLKGQTFGPYTLVRRLGVGGMAETFEAIRSGPGGFQQRVCLKLVLPFFREREDFLALFEREARLAAKLRHSNLVGVIDFGEIEGVTYMALELVDGTDLATLLDSQPGRRVSADYVALVGHDLAAALEHAHDPRRDGSSDGPGDNAIVHRDISPSNVLVSQRGEILLTDFGVAKAITGTARQQSAVKGKVPYMSPEQLRSEPLDGRSDLFALGVVLYESLAGHRPFQGEHDPATIMLILNGDRPDLLQVAADTPPGLAEVVERLLEPDRDARPESASALLEMLDPFVPSPKTRRDFGKIALSLRTARNSASPGEPTSGSSPTTPSKGSRSRDGSGVAPVSGASAVDEMGATAPTPSQDAAGEAAAPKRGSRVGPIAAIAIVGVLALWFGLRGLGESEVAEPAAPAEAAEAATAAAGEPSAAGPSEAADAAAGLVAPQSNGGEEGQPPVEPPSDGSSATGTDAPTERAASPEPKDPQPAAVAKSARLSVVVFPWGEVWVNGKRRGAAPLEGLALPPGRYRVAAGQGKPSSTKVVRLREGQRRTVEFDLSE